MHARVNTTEWNPDRVEDGIRLTEETIIPSFRKQPGFRGYFLLTEPHGEEVMLITLWDTEEDLQNSAVLAQATVPKLNEVLRAPPVTRTYEVLIHDQP